MSTATLQRPATKRPKGGGVPARRAVIRWAIRLLRREWRQQLLIFALITVAVAATLIASAVATTTPASPAGTLGTAQFAVTFSGTSRQAAADIAAVKNRFGQADVIEDQQVSVPGSVQTFDLRAQDPHGPFGQPLLSLVSGSYPATAGQVAVTSGVAADFSLHAGSTWSVHGVRRTVTGIVQNPQSLLDEFALVIPGQVTSPGNVVVLFDAPGMTDDQVSSALPGLPGVPNLPDVTSASSLANSNAINPETISLAAATLGMLLIALVGIGGFTVLAQRRLRSIGMLAAQGATERHIRLVVRANGVATGVGGAVAGFVIGLIGWLLYRPTVQSSAHHVIGTFQLPWTVIIVSTILAVAATFFASSRPAKTISRIPVVAALSGRPPAAKKRGRLVVGLIGIAFLVASFFLLRAAGATSGGSGGGLDGGGERALEGIVVGLLLLCVAVLMVSPRFLGVVAWLGRRGPIAVRLALRDLSRYRSRSGPALAAIALATLIAVLVCVESAARFDNTLDYAGPNLTSSQLIVYSNVPPSSGSIQVTPNGQQGQGTGVSSAPVPSLVAQAKVAQDIARSLGNADIITLYQTNAGLTRESSGRQWSGQIYLATPQLLRMFGISQSQIDPSADILTMRPGLSTMSLMWFSYGGNDDGRDMENPPIQEVSQLPSGTSAPNTVITEHAVDTLHLQPWITTSGWFIQVPGGLSAVQIRSAQQAATTAGLSVETRNSIPSPQTIVNDATVFGIVLALAILGMSVGLVRAEAARDLRTLSVTGASGTTRCILVATTAAALGFTGALIGMAGGYLAAIGYASRNHLDPLSELDSIPMANLLLILVGMPLIAAVVAWLLTLREPSAIARQPLE